MPSDLLSWIGQFGMVGLFTVMIYLLTKRHEAVVAKVVDASAKRDELCAQERMTNRAAFDVKFEELMQMIKSGFSECPKQH